MSHATRSHARAFSIIELMVVISIIGLLIAILLPALAGARASGRQVLALANARTLGQTFQTYLDAHDNAYPFAPGVSDPNLGGDEVIFVEWYPQGTLIGTNDVFMLSWAWPGVVSSVAPWAEHYATWVSPGKSTDLPVQFDDRPDDGPDAEEDVSWRMSNAFLADPELFTEDATLDKRPFRAVRAGEVVFPAQKVLAWDTHLAYLSRRPDLRDGHWDAPTPMLFVDGHAEAKNPLDAQAPATDVLSNYESRALADTSMGARGRDY